MVDVKLKLGSESPRNYVTTVLQMADLFYESKFTNIVSHNICKT
jgi:hypothetical protein